MNEEKCEKVDESLIDVSLATIDLHVRVCVCVIVNARL